MDEAIAQLVGITASTPDIARQYVQLADGDVNQAVQLYFENGGADLAGNASAAPPPAPSSSRPTGAGNAQNPINLGDDDNISDDNDPEITGFRPQQQHAGAGVEDDEALARRLQEEMYGDSEQTIRAPIARQSDTLLGPGAGGGGLGGDAIDDAVQERIEAMQQRRRQGESFRRSLFACPNS
jgi:UBX domain-containing protein 7